MEELGRIIQLDDLLCCIAILTTYLKYYDPRLNLKYYGGTDVERIVVTGIVEEENIGGCRGPDFRHVCHLQFIYN